MKRRHYMYANILSVLVKNKILTGRFYSSRVTALENSRKKRFLNFKELCEEMFSILLQFHRTISQRLEKIGEQMLRHVLENQKISFDKNFSQKGKPDCRV